MHTAAFCMEGCVATDAAPVLGELATAFLALRYLRGRIQVWLALEVAEDRVAFLIKADYRLTVILHCILLLL